MLQQIFAMAFAGLSKRIKLSLPQFQQSLQFLDSVSPGHEFPSYEDCEADLSRLSKQMHFLRDSVNAITPNTLEAAWASQFGGGTEAIKQCESLYKRIAGGIARAAAERRAQNQEHLTSKATAAAEDANRIADAARRSAEDTARKADAIGKKTVRWAAAAAVVAALALGWDGYKWFEDQHEKAQKKSEGSSRPSRPETLSESSGSSPTSIPVGGRSADSSPISSPPH
jgi:hypothetical protein